MMNENSTGFELVQPSAVQALERAAVDSQVATAHMYPRSLADFRKRALAMATLDLETAQSCIYHRPVGKDPDTGRDKIAEGESIRMAEIVGAAFGNLRVGARIIEQTPIFVRAEGVAHDLESNYAGKSEVVESTVNKRGQPYSERQRVVVAKAALSKAYRDAIFKVVPRSMCKFIRTAAEQVIRKEALPMEERRKKAVAWGKTEGVDEQRLCAALGVKGVPEIGEDQLIILTGIRTALKEGDTTIEEAFPPVSTLSSAPTHQKQQAPPQNGDKLGSAERKGPTLVESPISQEEKELAEAGLAPQQTQSPKEEPTTGTGNPEGAAQAPGAPSSPEPGQLSEYQQKLQEGVLSVNCDFDDFRRLAVARGWEGDWDSAQGFGDVPDTLAQSAMVARNRQREVIVLKDLKSMKEGGLL